MLQKKVKSHSPEARPFIFASGYGGRVILLLGTEHGRRRRGRLLPPSEAQGVGALMCTFFTLQAEAGLQNASRDVGSFSGTCSKGL